MTLLPARPLAWICLALIAVAAVGVEILPTLGAGVAGAVSLCTPRLPVDGAGPDTGLRDIAVLRAPRCGVA
jgi:hypothetical protein